MDDKPPMPPQPTTKQLPAMTDRALLEDLRGIVKDGFASQANTMAEFGERIVRVEDKLVEVVEDVAVLKKARKDNSIKVRGISENDLTQDAKHAETLMWRSAADNQFVSLRNEVGSLSLRLADMQKKVVSIHDAVVGVIENPKVKTAVGVLWKVVLAYAVSRGFIKELP